MALTEQEKVLIYRKAQDYVQSEGNALFRKEVIDALDEHADDELYDRFYTSLAFGTAGIRGVIGGGTNRINPFVVRKVTQGLADYLLVQEPAPVVVIAFDARNYSDLFAEQAALTLCANGVTVYLYDTLRPVPMLSFALRHLQATSGIVITASHNPAKYNGYKVYWRDGGQVTPPHDIGIADRVAAVVPGSIRTISKTEAKKKGLLRKVPKGVDEAYYNMVIESLSPSLKDTMRAVSVAYTPLHGAANIPVRTLLAKLQVPCAVVEQQELPDGDFPTVSMPNPEDPQAMRLAIELGIEVQADIVLGTDPDGDRLGIAIPTDAKKTAYELLTGNQIAVLLTDYLLTRWHLQHQGPCKQPVVVKSFVTTDLVREIAEKEGALCIDVLTGFKYIAEQIAQLEHSQEQCFLFGCEESFGYLGVPHVRDKDAVSTALLAVEMLSFYAAQGMCLQDRLDQIYQTYGYYTEVVLSFAYEGSSGQQKMATIMKNFRKMDEGDSFATTTVTQKIDLLEKGADGLPPSDVIILTFASGDKMVIRPSGTEPKIKYYLFFHAKEVSKKAFQAKLQERIAQFKSAL
ncbi:MAG: phospho-sugar mutase [Sphaerochaetaceae bacterium]|nr:phospho-sugar mutase [Sphaerochaetaceae bacterium]